jgi:FRG domain
LIASLYQGQNITVPTSADVECEWDDKRLKLSWITDIGTSGSAETAKSNADQPSIFVPLAMTWDDFKKYIIGFEPFRFIYRGRTNTWRIRCPFHRTGRGDMRSFFAQDIPALHRSLSARTTHVFNLTDALQNAAFLNMVQHHGYPTPLLDWTYSPFVAAYFAYHDVRKLDAAKATPNQKVRIFVFDAKEWRNTFLQILNASVRWQHFSLIEPIAIENERLIPQQALSSFTTVDDIETYIADKEAAAKKQFLRVVDLLLRDRDLVIRELTLMGVTAVKTIARLKREGLVTGRPYRGVFLTMDSVCWPHMWAFCSGWPLEDNKRDNRPFYTVNRVWIIRLAGLRPRMR